MGILFSKRNRVHPSPNPGKGKKSKRKKRKKKSTEVEYIDIEDSEEKPKEEKKDNSTSTTPIEIIEIVDNSESGEEEIEDINEEENEEKPEEEIDEAVPMIIEQENGSNINFENHDLRQSLVIEQDDEKMRRIDTSEFRKSIEEDGFDTLKNHLTFKVITWNLQGRDPPPDEMFEKILGGCSADIVAIGSQECSRSIAKNFIFPSKMKWETALKNFMSTDYVKMRSYNLVATHLILFVKRDLAESVQDIRGLAIPTGWMNDTLGNKGGVIISFSCNNNDFLFINCHLVHRQSNHEGRDTNYNRIINELNMWVKQRYKSESIFEKYDAIFIFGDLNYRLNGNRKLIDRVLKNGMMEVLKNNDQLAISRKRKSAFHHFEESEFEFPPTYKFDKNSDVYDTSEKRRVPAWTDRVLYFSKDKELIKLTRYDAAMDCMYSDHRPVFASFIKRNV